MSKLSFIVHCIEQYSTFKSMKSDEVYLLFKKNGIIDLLSADYQDLHGCGFEYLMTLIDKIINLEK